MAEKIYEHKLNVILVQIDEAHSDAWPVAINSLLGVSEPKVQQCLQDRVDRANEFVSKYNCPYPVYVDSWDNRFAELFRAWPDKFHCVDNKTLTVIAKSEYYKDTNDYNEAKIIDDYTVLLEKLMQ
jgi:hypothetical protein